MINTKEGCVKQWLDSTKSWVRPPFFLSCPTGRLVAKKVSYYVHLPRLAYCRDGWFVFNNCTLETQQVTLTGLNRMYSVSLFAKNKAMLCRVLVSLDLSSMYVSLTTLRTLSEKQRRNKTECFYTACGTTLQRETNSIPGFAKGCCFRNALESFPSSSARFLITVTCNVDFEDEWGQFSYNIFLHTSFDLTLANEILVYRRCHKTYEVAKCSFLNNLYATLQLCNGFITWFPWLNYSWEVKMYSQQVFL